MYTRLVTLIISRFIVILALLAFGAFANVPLKPLILFSVVAGLLSVAYYVLLRISERHLWQAYVQLIGDTVLVTWLTHELRDTDFPLIPLHLVIIFVAAIVLPRSGSIAIGLLATANYLAVLVMFKTGLLEGKYIDLQNSPALYVAAMLTLTVLGGQLAERLRRNDAELETATRYAADLRAYNERIVESIKSGLVTTDLDGFILTFNRAAEEITGHRLARVRGKAFGDTFGDVSARFTFHPSPFTDAGERFRRFEIDCRAADERVIRLGFTACPLTSEAGAMTGYVFSFQDLTEILKLEQEIRRQDRLAALGKMAAGIAHEIRNPLAAMRGSIQVLQSELDLNEDHAHLMKIVLRESDRLNGIINDFLAYARPSPPRFAPVDLIALVEETMTLVRYSPEVKPEHRITVVGDESSLAMVADPGQLKQVIWNLARNAIQAMPQGGELQVGVKRLPNDEIEIRLADTGRGLSPAEAERMFEPFNSSRPGGTGLGMAIVYQIVQDHGGSVRVENRTDGENVTGAEALIRLPRQALSEELSHKLAEEMRFRTTHRTPSGVSANGFERQS
jgi:two-component system sensor histidine kinase PilS (NtrC family)